MMHRIDNHSILQQLHSHHTEMARGLDGAYCGAYATVDGRVTAVRRAEAKAQQGPRTTRSTEADEPLAGNDLPDDWFHCANCGKDCDPAEVKLAYSDIEMCGEECTAARIKSLEKDVEDLTRVGEHRKAALRKIIDGTYFRAVQAMPLTWFAVQKHARTVHEIAVNGLYLIKDEEVEQCPR